MTDSNIPPSLYKDDHDDFDLFDLVTILWQGKLWIAGTVAVSVLAGFLYLFTTDELWTSQARVIVPDYRDIQLISDYSQQLKPVFGDDFDNAVRSIKIDSANDIFKRFIILFNSPDNKHEYLSNNVLIKNHFQADQALDGAIHEIAQSIHASGGRNDTESFDLVLSSWSAESSRNLLGKYINFTSAKVAEQIHANFETLLNQRIKELKRSSALLTNNTRNRIKTSIDHLSHSLAIASAAGIEKPIVDPGTGGGEEFMINMGTKAIGAKIQELKAIENLAVIEPRLLTIQNQLVASADVHLELPDHFQPYEKIQTPTSPLFRDHPKKTLIMIIALFVGGVMGCAGVLVAYAIRSRRHKI